MPEEKTEEKVEIPTEAQEQIKDLKDKVPFGAQSGMTGEQLFASIPEQFQEKITPEIFDTHFLPMIKDMLTKQQVAAMRQQFYLYHTHVVGPRKAKEAAEAEAKTEAEPANEEAATEE